MVTVRLRDQPVRTINTFFFFWGPKRLTLNGGFFFFFSLLFFSFPVVTVNGVKIAATSRCQWLGRRVSGLFAINC